MSACNASYLDVAADLTIGFQQTEGGYLVSGLRNVCRTVDPCGEVRIEPDEVERSLELHHYECFRCGSTFDEWWQVEDHWIEKTPEQAKCPHNDFDDYFMRCGDCGLET